MPTYLNNTTRTINWKRFTWGPGESKAIGVFVPASTGLTLVSNTPAVPSPIIHSDVVVIGAGATVDVQVPYCGRFLLSAIAIAGSATMLIGDGTEAVPVDAVMDYEGKLEWDYAAVLHLSSVAGATVQLVMEVA